MDAFEQFVNPTMPIPGPVGTVVTLFFVSSGGSNQPTYRAMPCLCSWYADTRDVPCEVQHVDEPEVAGDVGRRFHTGGRGREGGKV